MAELAYRSDTVEVVVLPDLGGRIHRLRHRGHDLLRTPADVEAYRREPIFWGSYVMAPWCNRIAAKPTEVGGRLVDVASNFGDGSAIHGQVLAKAWERQADGSLRVAGGDDGWPWRYEVVQRLTPGEDRLELEQVLVNRSDEPMPAGLGIHPWFAYPIRLAVSGSAVYTPNDAAPARPEPVAGELDLRALGDVPDGLDGTWTDLGDPAVRLERPDLGLAATIRVDAPGLHVVVASRDDFGAVGIEPQTHAPQGLRRLVNGEPGAMAWLEPGAALRLRVELSLTSAAG
jgi:aldose 1-epimerase